MKKFLLFLSFILLSTVTVKSQIRLDSFIVDTPITDLKDIEKYFPGDFGDELSSCCLKYDTGGRTIIIKLVKLRGSNVTGILKQIDSLGFKPVPTPYLLGLGMKYSYSKMFCDSKNHLGWPDIISLDTNNICFSKTMSENSFIYLTGHSGPGITIGKVRFSIIFHPKEWSFAVMKK
ncbi:MAG: hypothetical protein WDK96_00815 [Candidatus Paceibacterota bacterium]|jgi:hypothetical protein